MGLQVQIGDDRFQVTAQPLSPQAFAPFGNVTANPQTEVGPLSWTSPTFSLPSSASWANQQSAIRYGHLGRIQNLYNQAPSRRGEPVMSLFVCAARELTAAGAAEERLAISVLERHPFTTQTFVPLLSSASTYLVVVAPSLPSSREVEHLPAAAGSQMPGRGLPDLGRLRAFIATGAQAVTYGPGIWHAPMAALGPPGTTLDFVVWQHMSGVESEDCQLADLVSSSPPSVEVRILSSDLACGP